MYSRILIATDGSELAARGLEQGLALAKALAAEVTVLTVSEPWMPIGVDATGFAASEYGLIEDYEAAMASACRVTLEGAEKTAAAAGIRIKTLHIPRQYPADAIVETAASQKFELIVMASHGRRGIGRMLLGSQANAVLTHSSVPVLIVK